MILHDKEARDRIARDLDHTLVVEAAAGTGKTTALVGRIVAIVKSRRATLKQIIAVTFTEKAAGEMKLRLRGELEKARTAVGATADEKTALESALEELEVARIGTIHALCADLLREHPIEARVDPLFEVAKEPESQLLLDAAFDAWLPGILRDPPEGVRRLLRRRPKRRDQAAPRELLRRAAWQLVGHRDFDAKWEKPALEREALLDSVLPELRALGAVAREGETDDYLAHNLLELQRFVEDLDHRERNGRGRDYDGLEAGLAGLARHRTWSYKGFGEKFGGTLLRSELVARRDALKVQLDRILEETEAHLAACLHEDLWPLVGLYKQEKDRSGTLDFFDLLIQLKELLVGDAKVRAELQQRFTHLFVDEFQDTDPLQADILRLLAADDPTVTDPDLARIEPGKLFIVGDPKQSIYRFRRADVALYEQIKRRLRAEVLDLTTSFRGAPALQEAINTAFKPVMVQEEGGEYHTQARYVPLTRWREGVPDQPSLVALPVPRPYSDYGKISGYQVDKSYPDAVGAFVQWLVEESGWRVHEPGPQNATVPLQARHVCILFRRFRRWEGDDVTLGYTRALEARGIPHVLVGGRSFHGREEVLALRNALAAIEWPDDELSLYATLRGPLFALSDDQLLVYRDTAKRGFRAFRRVDDEALPPAAREVSRALDVLVELHKQRNRRPIGDTIASLLEATRAHAGVAFWPAGEQALANLAQLTDLARRYEGSGGRSFRGFVDQLARQAERGEVPEAPIVEEASEGVRMMTVHGAKGLEFPVVILADPTCPMTQKNPSQWVEGKRWSESLAHCVPRELRAHAREALKRDEEESVRLTYVAATRARDLLVVPAVGDEELTGTWLDPLLPVIYPSEDGKRRPLPAPGCPKFNGESVIDRPEKARFRVSVMPGLHRSAAGQHPVVWWDPLALQLDKKLETGLHQDQVLREKGGEQNAARSLAEYRAWASGRASLLERGAKASTAVTPARDATQAPSIAVTVEQVQSAREGRPRGRRFGTLVHAALATVPLSPGPELERYVRAHGRRLGATDEEQRAAVGAVEAALQHPLLTRAAAAQGCRREAPLTVKLEDGTLAEGVADLAFRDAGGWTVVDFKTDFELEEHRARYEQQVSVYARAIAQATGLPASAWLLSV
ncbi:MAG: UvrD-helicase domain-containing protein [Archangiaceae bacterium]|nr:UvrD-helicase domain-containing protein [Archangiaceae bacterium]